MTKILAGLALILAMSIFGCYTFAAGQQVAFTPQNGFGGNSRGDGTLQLLFGRARHFHVESRGSEQGGGTFRLEQMVTFLGQAPESRVWVLRTVSPGQYLGTLTDAAGGVTGTTSGPRLTLRYRVKGLFVMHQELQWMPDGKTIDNVGTITLLGIPVGHLHETITREAPGMAPGRATRGTP